MPFLVKKIIKGNTYFYLRHNHRVEGKVKTAWQIYLGSEETLQTRGKFANLEYTTETIEFGLLAALLHIAKELDLVSIINRHTRKRQQGVSVGNHLLFAALNRCVQPTSKSQIKGWFSSTMLQNAYPDIDTALDSRAYWSHFRYLSEENIEDIENDLIKAMQKEYGVSINDLSFDPTNFYSFINPYNEDTQKLPKHGHSKESRATLNIINMSLFSTLDAGVPLFHLVYSGNIQDAMHFKNTALPALKKRLKKLNINSENITLVFDKGNLSSEGFSSLDSMGLNYICSDRPSTHKNLLGLPPESFEMQKLPNGKMVGVKEFRLEKYGKKRRFIAVLNPKQAKWNKKNLETKVLTKISKINGYLQTRVIFKPGEERKGTANKWRIKEEVEKKINAMIGGNPYKKIISFSIEGPEEIPIIEGGKFNLKIGINAEKMTEKVQKLGKGFLMTSRNDLTPLEVVWTYRQQYLVERAFKWLKSGEFLTIRPMFHRVDNSIRGHIFVCQLGLLLLTLLVRKLVKMQIPTSIYQVVKLLKEIRMTRVFLSKKADPLVTLDTMSPEAKKIYDALDLKQFI